MLLKPQSEDLNDYLQCTDIVDFNHPEIVGLSGRFRRSHSSAIELIKALYEYVRDEIHHSADINGKVVTCKASDVLKAKEGICYAKSNLLAALLRMNYIPAGFCYQILLLNEDIDSPLVVHGLVAVYIEELNKWIRLDVRGNKLGVNAQFSIEKEKLAFPVRPEKGEKDLPVIFTSPDLNVTRALTLNQTLYGLWINLPESLAYE